MKKLLLTLIGAALAMSVNAVNWFISGSFQGWNHANANYQLKETSSGIFEIEVAEISGEFLICQGTVGSPDWNNKVGTNGSKVKPDVAYNYVVNGGNFNLDGTVKNATVTLNTNAKTLLIAGKAEENDYTVVYLVGDFGSGWNEALQTHPLTLKSGTTNVWEGSYTLTAATSYFKMRAGNIIYGTGGNDVNVVLGTQYTASQSGNSYAIKAGKYNFSFVLDKNADTGKLTVTDGGAVEYPPTIYVLGNVKGNTDAFNPTITAELPTTGENGKYKADIEISDNQGGGYGYFQLCTKTGASATDWSGLGTRYGAAEENMNPLTGTMSLTSNDLSWMVEPGTYTIAADLAAATMTVTKVAEPEPVVTYPELYVRGQFNNNVADATSKMTVDAATGVYTITLAKLLGNFKIASAEENWNPQFSTRNTAMTVGTEYAMQDISGEYGGDMAMTGGVKNATVTFDYKNMKLKVTGTAYTPEEGYSINSSLTDANWSMVPMTKDGDKYTYKVTVVNATGEMQVVKTIDGTPSEYMSNGTVTLSATTSSATVGVGQANLKYSLTAGTEYTFSYDPATSTLSVEATSTPTPDPVEPTNPNEATFKFTSVADVNATMAPGVPAITSWTADGSTGNNYYYIGTQTSGKVTLTGGDTGAQNATAPRVYATASNIFSLRVSKTSTLKVSVPEGYEIEKIVFYSDENYIKNLSYSEDAEGTFAKSSTTDPKAYYGTWTAPEKGGMRSVDFGATSTARVSTITVTYKEVATPEPEPVTYPVLYLRGAFDSFGTTTKMNVDENGIYTVSMDKLSGEFKIADADWSDDNSWTSENKAMEVDTDYTLTTYANAPNMEMAKSLTDVTITFDYTTKVMKVTGTEVTTPAVITYTIKGTFTDPAWAEQQMTADGEAYTWTGSLAAPKGSFMITENKDGVADKYFKATATTETLSADNAEITLVVGSDTKDASYDFDGANVDQMTFTFTPATGALKATWTTVSNPEPEPEPVTYPDLYFRGASNGYDTSAKMTVDENGVYTYSIAKLTGEFKLADADWSDANSWTSENKAMVLDTEYTLVSYANAPNMSMANTIENAVITFNYTTKVMKVTGTVSEVPAVITYTIKGTFNDWTEAEMTKSDVDDTYSWTGTLAAASGSFLVIENKDGVADKYYKDGGIALTATNAEITLVEGAANDATYDFTGAGVDTMTFTFDPATASLKASWTSGIADLSVDFDPAATYYNLQGRQVKNPTPGLYIVVRDNTVTKEYLK